VPKPDQAFLELLADAGVAVPPGLLDLRPQFGQ